MGRGVNGFMARNSRVFKMGFLALAISSGGDLIAGATLGYMTDTLALLPGLMILIPAAIGMRGNIFGALGSRLGTSMHMGTFELSLRKGGIMRSNVQASLLLTVIMSCAMGFLARGVSLAFGVDSISVLDFVFISVLGGILAGLVLLGFNILIARMGFLRNWDIDNISAPLITAAGDIVTLPMLFLSAWFVMGGLTTMVDIGAMLFTLLALLLVMMAYTSKGDDARRILYQSAPVLTLCILMDMGAGITVENHLEAIVALPALIILYLPFLNEANALGGILTSRLGSQLHMGLMRPNRFPDAIARENFRIIYVFSLVIFLVIGVAAELVASAMGMASPGMGYMIAISFVAGLLTISVLNLIGYYVAMVTYRLRLDPDDHSIPLTSSSIDLVGTLFFIGMIMLLGI